MFHVEHSLRRLFCILVLITLSGAVGCKSENPNPELMDPIYSDLKKSAEEAKKAGEAAKKELDDARVKLSKLEANTIEVAETRTAIAKAQRKLDLAGTEEKYLTIRAERRRVEGRAAYRKAFKADQPWPDPSEYQGYLANKRLRAASMNWNKRVPKLTDRLPSSETPKGDKK